MWKVSQEEVEQLKRDLESYNFNSKEVQKTLNEIMDVNHELSGLAKRKVSSASTNVYHDRKVGLIEKRTQLEQKLHASHEYKSIKKIDTMMASLNCLEQDIIREKFFNSTSYRSIAKMMQCDESTIRKKAYAILRFLVRQQKNSENNKNPSRG